MELNEKQIDQVGEYIHGRLKGKELSDFLKEVDTNAHLKEEIRVQQAIVDGMEHRRNQELKTRFKNIADESKETTKEPKIISMRLFKMVASIAAMIMICFAAYNIFNTSSDTESLYTSYFEPSELTITRSTDVEADLMKLKELYNTKKYDKALPLFKNIVSADPTSSNLRLAYGNTLLKCNKVAKARAEFNYIIEANDPLYSDQARWYLGLLELKEGNELKAKGYFNALSQDQNSDYHSEAKEILEKIK